MFSDSMMMGVPDAGPPATSYLFRAEFNRADITGITNGDIETQAAGSILDGSMLARNMTGGTIEIINNRLRNAGTGSWPTWGLESNELLNHAVGRGLVYKMQLNQTLGGPLIGFAEAAKRTNGGASTAYLVGSNDLTLWGVNYNSFVMFPAVPLGVYEYAQVQGVKWSHRFIKGEEFTNWTLWSIQDTASLIGNSVWVELYDLSADYDLDYMRVPDWDLSAATTANSALTTPAASTAFTDTADNLMYFAVSALPTSGVSEYVAFRWGDDLNKYRITIDSAGTIKLEEVVGGVATPRGSAYTGVTATSSVNVICDGPSIKVQVGNVFRISYSAAIYQTNGNSKIGSLANGAAISVLESYPRTSTVYDTELNGA